MRRVWTIFLLLSAAALGAAEPPAPAPAGPDEAAAVQFADGLFRRGIYDMAIKEYMLFLEQFPTSALADAIWFRSGECYREMGNRVAADRAYSRVQAMSGSAHRFRAVLRRAELFAAAGQPESAAGLLQALLADSPPADVAADALFRLAGALDAMGRPADVAPVYERLLREHPGSPFEPYAWLALGTLAAERPDGAAKAEAWLTRAAEKAGDARVAAEAWFQLGHLHYRGSNYVKSAYAFDQLLTRFGSDLRAESARLPAAWACHRAGRHADAVALADQALAAGARPSDGWLYLAANSERQLARHAAAADRYGRLLRECPDSVYAPRSAYERALALFNAGRHAEAVDQARAIPPGGPMEDQVCWLLAESAIALGDENGAIQNYRLIADRHPGSPLAPEAWYRIGDLLNKRGEAWNAATAYRELFLRYPASGLAPKGLFAAAYGAAKTGRREDAARDWGRFLETFPQHELAADALFQKAVAEAQLGRNEQALVSYETLLRRFPKTPYAADARFWSGVLLETAGRYEDAARELRAALAAEPSVTIGRLARMRLSLVLFRLGQLAEAADLAQATLATPLRQELPPGLLEWLAETRLREKAPDRALEAAQLLSATNREPTWRQIGLALSGDARLALGRAEEARADYRAATALGAATPAEARAWMKLGDLALAESAFTDAETAYGEAVRRAGESDRVRALATAGLARALEGQGNWAGAARFYMNVALLYQEPALTPECYFKAAEMFRKQGRSREAEELRAELRKQFPGSPWASKE